MSELYTIRQIGRSVSPNRIRWEDGSSDICDCVPVEFCDGRWFDAQIVRDEDWRIVEFKLIKEHIEPKCSEEELREFWKSIPPISLPDEDWE